MRRDNGARHVEKSQIHRKLCVLITKIVFIPGNSALGVKRIITKRNTVKKQHTYTLNNNTELWAVGE